VLAFVVSVSTPDVLCAQMQEWAARYTSPGPRDSDNKAVAIAVDTQGNVYVTGQSAGVGTALDYVTIKYDPAGNQLWLARYDGPSHNVDESKAIAVDAQGNVYVTGTSWGAGTSFDFATVKYDPAGNQLWVARYNGPGNGQDYGLALAVDAQGNVYVTGGSEGVGTGLDYATVKYDSAGNQVWVTRFSGPSDDIATAISVDGQGNAHVTGGSCSRFIRYCVAYAYTTIKYDPAGNELWVAHYVGQLGGSGATALAIDAQGNVHVTGGNEGVGTGYDYATIKYDSIGNQLWVARYDGPANGRDQAKAIALDAQGNVYVTGESQGVGTGDDYATIAYDPPGNQLWVARYNGPGNGDDSAAAIAVDAGGNAYVTGKSWWDNVSRFDYGTIKYDPAGNQLWVARYGPCDYDDDQANAIGVDATGNVYVTGSSVCGSTLPRFDWATIKYSQPCDVIPGNLVSNCGFETGDLTSWSQSGDQSDTFVIPQCRHSSNNGLCAGPVSDLGFISQTLQTAADQTYTVSFWLGNAGAPNHFQVYWDGNLVSDQVNQGDFDYRQFTLTGLQATGGATELKFGFFNLPGYFDLDDVVVLRMP
jgi:hypothetical protein